MGPNQETHLQRTRTQFGWTALHHASNWGYLECVKTLVELGADVDAQSESGRTACEAANFKGFNAVVEYLLEVPPSRPPSSAFLTSSIAASQFLTCWGWGGTSAHRRALGFRQGECRAC